MFSTSAASAGLVVAGRRVILHRKWQHPRLLRISRFPQNELLRCLGTTTDSFSNDEKSAAASPSNPKVAASTTVAPRPVLSPIIDANPLVVSTLTKTSNSNNNHPKMPKVFPRLPPVTGLEEFPPDRTQALRRQQATYRILKIAADRLVEPPTLHLLAFSAWATMSIALIEGVVICREWPLLESLEAAKFTWWYSVEQLIPSIVWDSQDAATVARSLDMDPSQVLRNLALEDSNTATALLHIRLLQTTRYFVAGFMMIASIVRAAGVSAGAFAQYEERIRLGREPPLRIFKDENPGVVLRMCGRDSYTTEVSLQKMGVHIFPVFEHPDRVQYLVWRHSEQLHRPVYWCVKEHKYGSAYSWDRFPTDETIFCPPLTWNPNPDGDSASYTTEPSSLDNAPAAGPKLLILEADCTNAQDPLALGNAALDLNLDDASQGFRRIQERFSLAHPKGTFRTLRVYLGNSLELKRTGGGHRYTLRHRVAYAKEVDVLLDSRAPVLERILDWCRRVAGKDKRICFQTSSQEYFTSLQKILQCYGYEIYDPLDLRTLWLNQQLQKHQQQLQQQQQQFNDESNTLSTTESNNKEPETTTTTTSSSPQAVPPSILAILMEDPLLYDMWQERGTPGFLADSFQFGTSKEDKDDPSPVATNDDDEKTSQHGKKKNKNAEMLRQIARLAKLPRLVHMPTTAETVNAVEALITAGEVDSTNCCAILERQEGVAALEYILQQKSDLVRGERYQEWVSEEDGEEDSYSNQATDAGSTNSSNSTTTTDGEDCGGGVVCKGGARWTHSRRRRAGGGAGLQMICTSTIYDDLFRQVRIWARMGFTSTQIQKEMDLRFHEILEHSNSHHEEVPQQESITTGAHDRHETGPADDDEPPEGLPGSASNSKSKVTRGGPEADPHS